MNKSNLPVEWYLQGKKRPFAYSTVAESDSIAVMLEMYGNLRMILNAYNRREIILSPNEVIIIQKFVDNGELNPPIRY